MQVGRNINLNEIRKHTTFARELNSRANKIRGKHRRQIENAWRDKKKDTCSRKEEAWQKTEEGEVPDCERQHFESDS